MAGAAGATSPGRSVVWGEEAPVESKVIKSDAKVERALSKFQEGLKGRLGFSKTVAIHVTRVLFTDLLSCKPEDQIFRIQCAFHNARLAKSSPEKESEYVASLLPTDLQSDIRRLLGEPTREELLQLTSQVIRGVKGHEASYRLLLELADKVGHTPQDGLVSSHQKFNKELANSFLDLLRAFPLEEGEDTDISALKFELN